MFVIQKLCGIVGVEEKHKVAESIWKILFYSITWVWSAQLLFCDGEDYFFALGKHYQCTYKSCCFCIARLKKKLVGKIIGVLIMCTNYPNKFLKIRG